MKTNKIIFLDNNNKKIELSKPKRKSSFSTRLIIFLIICLIAVSVCLGFKIPLEEKLNPKSYFSNATIDESGLTTHFVDVGQGDGMAIRLPDGKTMVIDAGPKKNADDFVEYLKTSFFKQGEETIDYLILTHSDEDHCGGMAKVCENFTVEKIIRPKIYSKYTKSGKVVFDETQNLTNITVCTTLVYSETIQAFNAETSNIIYTDINLLNTTQKIAGDNYSIDFYYPLRDYITEDYIDKIGTVVNNYSPIMVLNYQGRKIMLTGDVSTAAENYAMEAFDLPDIDVLKIAHHGSRTSTGMKFLYEIEPEYSVISCGADNTYGHPTEDVLNRLMFVGSTVFRTDLSGDIVLNVTSNGEMNFFYESVVLSANVGMYIHVEYIMFGVILVGAISCFAIWVRKKY